MTIKDLTSKYNLTQDDFWELPTKKGGCWIISHDACEKIMHMEKIELIDIQVINSERDFARFIISMSIQIDGRTKSIKTIGEADKSNSHNQYYGCMAEKRGIDRAVLKLINAYQYGVYSEIESGEFSKWPLTDLPESKIVYGDGEATIQMATKEQWSKFGDIFKISGNKEKIEKYPDIQKKCINAFENKDTITKIMMSELLDEIDPIVIPF
jgi:hypothetical protein